MVNLTIPYRSPVPAASTLWREVQARWPDCAENKGFVAGSGPTTWNISSHNADADGFAHALDIGVDIEGDGTGIPIQDAIDLSEHLRAIGYKEWKSGRAGRLAYIIHRGQIAGDHTGWAWVAYTGTSPHYDHIHVSFSFDYYWGDPVWESTSEVHSTLPWNLTTIAGQGSGITPIQEDDMAFTAEQETFIVKALTSLVENVATKETIKTQTNELPGKVWSYKNPGLGGADAYQILRDALSSSKKLVAEVAVLAAKAAVGGATVAQIEQAVKDGLADGVKVDATVTVAGSK